jgi:cell division protein FtsL
MKINTIISPVANLFTLISSPRAWGLTTLIGTIFLSALGVIYIQAESRLLFSQFQSMEQVRDELRVEWGQLLLEQGAWGTQARVENIAEQKLQMMLPKQNEIAMVNE